MTAGPDPARRASGVRRVRTLRALALILTGIAASAPFAPAGARAGPPAPAGTTGAAAPSGAPDGGEREGLLGDLAWRLGEAHAARRACQGPEDDLWRGWMARVLAHEGATGARAARLMRRFNAGFAAERAARPDCDRQALDDEAAARRAAAFLAERVAREPVQAGGRDNPRAIP